MSSWCVLCWEDRPTIDGRVIERGALVWRTDQPLPLLVHLRETPDYAPSFLIGTVGDIQRRPDGAITGELSHPIVGLAPEIDLALGDSTNVPGEPFTIIRARLSAVTLGIAPVWLDLRIQ